MFRLSPEPAKGSWKVVEDEATEEHRKKACSSVSFSTFADRVSQHGQCVYAGISADGALISTFVRGSRQLQIWRSASGDRLGTLLIEDVESGAVFSRNGERLAVKVDESIQVWDIRSGRNLSTLEELHQLGQVCFFDLPAFRCPVLFSPDAGNLVAGTDDPGAEAHWAYWSRRRPEYWWGIAWLPEFWIAMLSGGALLVIAARNLRRRFAKPKDAQPVLPEAPR